MPSSGEVYDLFLRSMGFPYQHKNQPAFIAYNFTVKAFGPHFA